MAAIVAASNGTRAPSPGRGVHVGCSGWTYQHWRGRFYPKDLPTSRWLEHYAAAFDCVETNGTFYRLPEAHTFADWAARTPPGFRLAVKASRFLTHMKRLTSPQEPLERLLSRAAGLGDKLGPILYQLPPDLQRNDDRLKQFVAALPRAMRGQQLRHVIEFRHPSWYVAPIFDLLANHNVSLCLHDKRGSEVGAPAIGPVLYVRFHGRNGEYFGRYSERAVMQWADRIVAAREGREVWVFFNNDPEAAAVADATLLRAGLYERLGAAHRRTPRLKAPRCCAGEGGGPQAQEACRGR